MPTDMKVDYLELPASDFDAVQQFYSDVFGWSFTDYGPEYRAFTDGRIDGGFYQSKLCSSTANGATLVVFYAQALEDVLAKVKASGGTIVKEIFAFPGGRRFQFTDLHGNELAVWSDK